MVSVGGLKVGGSGKTPVALLLTEMLVERGLNPVYITRGYKGAMGAKGARVVRRADARTGSALFGDEAYLAARRLPGVPVYRGAEKAGLIESGRDIIFAEPKNIECAYVIMDKNWEKAVSVIMGFLSGNSIISTGRYGSWTYSAMEDALLDGKNAAEKTNKGE